MQMIIHNKADLDIAYAKGIRRLYVTRTMTIDFHYGQWEVRGAKGCTVRINLHQKASAEVSGNVFVYAQDDAVVEADSGAVVTAISKSVKVFVHSQYDMVVRSVNFWKVFFKGAIAPSGNTPYRQVVLGG
jgi:hypothetical protein